MAVLSIICCKILQDEIVYLLENDPDINSIVVVENENRFEFLEKLSGQRLPYRVLPFEKLRLDLQKNEMDGLDESGVSEGITVVVKIMELGLHAVPRELKVRVYAAIEEMMPFSDGLLLFYGLCGNVLETVEEDFHSCGSGCRVRILRDSERIVDDCIGATVGGWANYMQLLKDHISEPTFFFTPMYAAAWRELFNLKKLHEDPNEALKLVKMMNDAAGYSRVAKVNTGLTYTEDFDGNINEFADLFGYSITEVSGGQDLFKNCYDSIKKELLEAGEA